MNRRSPVAQTLAIILVVAVPLVFVPPTAGQEGATLAGTVYLQEGRQPVDGAVLHAADLRTSEIYSSAATNDDGDFVLSGLPPAAYKLAIETDGSLYLVGTSVYLEAGQERDVQLALQPEAAADPKTAAEEDDDDEMGFINNPLFASLMVITGAILFGYLISELDDKNEVIGSPFTN